MEKKLKEELKENSVIMMVVPDKNYTKSVLEIVSQLSYLNKGVCYVTLNQMYDALLNYFKKNKVNCDNILFIDMITKSVVSKPPRTDNVIFVSDPSALTEMTILTKKIMNKKEMDILFFDSISTLLLYRNQSIVVKSIRDIITKLKKNKSKGILIALESDVKKGVFKDIQSSIDNIVYFGGNKVEKLLKTKE